MTKDRIKDLQKPTPWPRVSYSRLSRQRRGHEGQGAIADGLAPFITIEIDRENNVAEFLAQIDLLRLLIDKIDELIKEVDLIHKKMLEPVADSNLANKVDDLTADIKKLAYDVSTKLKKMELVQGSQDQSEKESAQWRIREAQILNMFTRFQEIMNRYNQESVSHRDRCKRAIVRELEISGHRKTDDELEDMIENGSRGTFFSVMVDVEKARQAANQIEARQRDILKLENSIKELHDMFNDLALLVKNQGGMIDNIEHNVSQTANYTKKGGDDLKVIVPLKTKADKKKLIICIILIAIVVILFLILGAYYATQKKILGK